MKLLNGGGDGGGGGNPLLLLSFLLNPTLTFHNTSSLFCLLKPIPGGGAFFQCQVLAAKIQQLDFAYQKWKCLQTLAREDFHTGKYFSIWDPASA